MTARALIVCDWGSTHLRAWTLGPSGEVVERAEFPFGVNRLAPGEASGTPDGSALDAEGFLWNAQWGAWRIVRYAPDGRVDRIVPMPVAQPSSCAFGGPQLTTLYVTSARERLSDAALAAQPLAGSLFAFEPGVSGLPLPSFAGRLGAP